MRIIKAILVITSITFARPGVIGPSTTIDEANSQVDSAYAHETGLRDSVTNFYKSNKNQINIQYASITENVLMKQYREHFPDSIKTNTSKEDIAYRSMGTWFPNLMRLQNDMGPCVIKSIFIEQLSQRENWNGMMKIFAFLKCANDIASTYKYDYK